MIDGQEAGADSAVLDDIFNSDRDRGADLAAPEDSSQPRDDMGRFASRDEPEPAQPQPEAQAQPEPETAEPEPSLEEQDDPHSIPRSAHIAERKKLQARIDELQRQSDERDAFYRQQLSQFQHPQHQQQAPELPDLFEDPDAAVGTRIQQHLEPFQHQMMAQLDQIRLSTARAAYGEVVDEAVKAANAAGLNDHFLQQPDPYGALVAWHKQAQTLAEVGDDPAAYREKIEKEVREKVLAEMQQNGGRSQQPRFPGTLADRTNAGQGLGSQLTPQAQLDDIFDPGRDRRDW